MGTVSVKKNIFSSKLQESISESCHFFGKWEIDPEQNRYYTMYSRNRQIKMQRKWCESASNCEPQFIHIYKMLPFLRLVLLIPEGISVMCKQSLVVNLKQLLLCVILKKFQSLKW